METQTIETHSRGGTGKGAARQLRSQGLIPAVFYGPDADPVSLSVSPKELSAALSTQHGRNAVLSLKVGEEDQLAIVQELQVHPVTRDLLHVDFYKVNPDNPIERKVPFTASGRAKGVVAGGDLNVMFRELPVRAAPLQMPAQIEVDVTNLDLNESIQVKDLQLAEGVQVLYAPERNVVAIVASRRRKAPEEEGQEAAAG